MNENIMIVSKIEGLLNEAAKNFPQLKSENSNQEAMVVAAIDELNEYQTETIHALRILFED